MKTTAPDILLSLHTGFWPAVRITVVIAMIVGAFILGSQCGRDKGGYGEHMMHSSRYETMDGKRNMQEMDNSMKNMDSMISHDPMSMSMADMGAMLAGKTGDDLNKAFLTGMITHHQGAIDMAKYLAASDKPELVKLGTDIIAAQQKEINQMKQWMIDWGYIEAGKQDINAISNHTHQ